MSRNRGGLRFELTEEELERIAAARRAPFGRSGFAWLLIRSPWLIPETVRIVATAVDRSLFGNSELRWLISAERARQVVPDAATGAGWYPEQDALDAIRPMLNGDMNVLELGCGAGRISRHIAEQVGSLTCTDVSRAMVAEARRNLAGRANVRVAQTDGFTLREFADEAFDLVFAAGLFGYVDPAQALGLLDEVRRVLRGEGILAFNLELIDGPRQAEAALARARDGARNRRVSASIERPYCLAQIDAWLRTAGLHLLRPGPADEDAFSSDRTNVVARRTS